MTTLVKKIQRALMIISPVMILILRMADKHFNKVLIETIFLMVYLGLALFLIGYHYGVQAKKESL